MSKKEDITTSSFPMTGSGMECCRVESVVSVDERGQMVLPKDIRERAGIRAGDKLALIVWEREGQVCCISMVKADALAGMVRNLLGPMMRDVSAP
jgi:AbrB family looped-hinge helix DNA binding protein